MKIVVIGGTDLIGSKLPPALIQPVAADDVASALAGVALGTPVNGIIEIAGPDRFRLDELIRRLLDARDDSREVITDAHARYWGISPSERSLLAGGDVRLGTTRFDDWLTNATPRRDVTTPTRSRRPAMHEIRVLEEY